MKTYFSISLNYLIKKQIFEYKSKILEGIRSNGDDPSSKLDVYFFKGKIADFSNSQIVKFFSLTDSGHNNELNLGIIEAFASNLSNLLELTENVKIPSVFQLEVERIITILLRVLVLFSKRSDKFKSGDSNHQKEFLRLILASISLPQQFEFPEHFEQFLLPFGIERDFYSEIFEELRVNFVFASSTKQYLQKFTQKHQNYPVKRRVQIILQKMNIQSSMPVFFSSTNKIKGLRKDKTKNFREKFIETVFLTKAVYNCDLYNEKPKIFQNYLKEINKSSKSKKKSNFFGKIKSTKTRECRCSNLRTFFFEKVHKK